MKCIRCQSENDDDAMFCGDCGADLMVVPMTNQKTSAFWWLLAFLMPLIGGIIGWWFVKGVDSNKANRLLTVSICVALLVMLGSFEYILSYFVPEDG